MLHLVEQVLAELFNKITLIAVVVSAIVSVFTSIATCLLILYGKGFLKSKKEKGEKSAQEQSQVVKEVTTASSSVPATKVTIATVENSEKVKETSINTQPNENRNCKSDKPLSNRERKRLEKQERKKQRERQRREERTEDVTKPAKITSPPEGAGTIPLTVADGQLMVVTIGKTEYYCCWTDGGKTYYMLNRDEKLINKAINNHTALIDPFCNKTEDSVEYSVAKTVVMEKCGVLNADYTIKDKAIIKYK